MEAAAQYSVGWATPMSQVDSTGNSPFLYPTRYVEAGLGQYGFIGDNS
jgi:hypothetical protein